jgi:hypothetical protein
MIDKMMNSSSSVSNPSSRIKKKEAVSCLDMDMSSSNTTDKMLDSFLQKDVKKDVKKIIKKDVKNKTKS